MRLWLLHFHFNIVPTLYRKSITAESHYQSNPAITVMKYENMGVTLTLSK